MNFNFEDIKLDIKEEVEVLRHITKIISNKLDLEEILNEIIDIVTNMAKGDSCLLYLFEKNDNELCLRASKILHKENNKNIKLKLGEGITGWVAQNKKVVSINKNAFRDPRFKIFHSLPEDRYHAFLEHP